MVYIEAFFYYLFVVISVFVLFYLLLFFLLLLVKGVKKRDKLNVFEIGDFFGSVIKHKLLKIFTLFYLTAFSVFYFIQLSTYLGSERAYPKAKMYKIVADVSMFYFDFFIANRDLYFKPSGLKYIQAYEQWQNHLMQKAFVYIPKDDTERAIWRYEYYYANYVRAMTAPIDFESLSKVTLNTLLKVGGHPTKYKPIAKEMIQEVGSLLDSLMEKPMQDKYYDEVNRYATIIMLGTWLEHYKFLNYSLGTEYPNGWQEFLNISQDWTDDESYILRVQKLVDFLDITKEHIAKSKQLQSFLKEHKYIYPDLMALRVGLMSYLVFKDFMTKELSCDMKNLQRYYQNRKDFIEYEVQHDSYRKLDWRERKIQKSLVSNRIGGGIAEYFLTIKCSVEPKSLIYKSFENKIKSEWEVNERTLSKTKQIIQRIENER